jgi:hypothetical protein
MQTLPTRRNALLADLHVTRYNWIAGETTQMAAPAERMKLMRERRRRRGLRELRLVVPNPRLQSVRKRVATQALRLDRQVEAEALGWMEKISEFDEQDSGER